MDFATVLEEFEAEFYRPEMDERIIQKCRKCGQQVRFYARNFDGEEVEGIWQCPCGATTYYD